MYIEVIFEAHEKIQENLDYIMVILADRSVGYMHQYGGIIYIP